MAFRTASQIVFACHTSACRPPTSGGTGGSSSSGGAKKSARGGGGGLVPGHSYKNLKPFQGDATGSHLSAAERAKVKSVNGGKKLPTRADIEAAAAKGNKRKHTVQRIVEERAAAAKRQGAPPGQTAEIGRGKSRTITGMGSYNGGKIGRYKNGQYWVKPPTNTGHTSGPVPLAARKYQDAIDEIGRLGR